jgi:TonB family protein
MRTTRFARIRLLATAILILGGVLPVSAQDSFANARDLYASAAYEDALAVLNRLAPADKMPAGNDRKAIEQYRAFCLLALGRPAEAEKAIEAVIVAEPTYHPSTDVSPRVRTAFSDVRRRMLPSIIQAKYAEAKVAFDKRDFKTAADGFGKVLDAMADPDLGAAAGQPPLSDLHTLALGFHDLAVQAAAPPPAPVSMPAPAAAAPARPAAPRVYSGGDVNVKPPVTINQTLPNYPTRPVPQSRGTLEIIIDESGQVESALMKDSVNSLYDALAMSATRMWRYRPATLDGQPVKYRKEIVITIKPAS